MKYWCSSDKNFGDAITPFLLTKLGIDPEFSKTPNLIGAGSILGFWDVRNMCKVYVWGSGFLNETDRLPVNNFKYLAVRGKLSAKKLKLKDIVLGDPGLLTSRCFPINATKKYKFGIICHCTDYDKFKATAQKLNKDILIINAQFKSKMTEKDLVELLVKINECEFIYSSSLHGLIIAHSYGIPAVYLRDLNNSCRHNKGVISADDFKFKDYYSAIDLNYSVLDWDDQLNFLKQPLNYNQLCPTRAVVEHIQNSLIKKLHECKESLATANKSRKPNYNKKTTYLYF